MVAPFPLMIMLVEELYYYAKDIDERQTKDLISEKIFWFQCFKLEYFSVDWYLIYVIDLKECRFLASFSL